MADRKRVTRVLDILLERFGNPGAMEIGDPYRTLVAVILSARTRDEQVLKLLPGFFDAFPTVHALAKTTPKQIEAKINTIGMYRQKAKNVNRMAQKVVGEFGGTVPETMDELVSLAGVGRKTASVVLVACFKQPAIAVDTHVHRVTNRLGWVQTKTPAKTEQELLQIIPRDVQWIVNRVFVKFGRYICIPGKPRCWMCPVRQYCQYPKKNLAEPANADAIRGDLDRRENDLERLRTSL